MVFKKHDPNLPLVIAGPLRVAKKYQINALVDRLQQQFLADWPDSYLGWEMLEEEIEQHKKFLGKSKLPNKSTTHIASVDDSFPEPCSAIQFAREFDLPQILPAAFYHLARIKFKNDWDVLRTGSDVSLDVRSARWTLLSREDLFCLIQGRDYLMQKAKELEESAPPRNRMRLEFYPYDVFSYYNYLVQKEQYCMEQAHQYFIAGNAQFVPECFRTRVWEGLREGFSLPVCKIRSF
jgi:hypothetical protein